MRGEGGQAGGSRAGGEIGLSDADRALILAIGLLIAWVGVQAGRIVQRLKEIRDAIRASKD